MDVPWAIKTLMERKTPKLLRLGAASWDHLVQALLEQCQLEEAAQDRAQSDFQYLHGWRFHSLYGPPLYTHTLFMHYTINAHTHFYCKLKRNCAPLYLDRPFTIDLSLRSGGEGIFMFGLLMLLLGMVLLIRISACCFPDVTAFSLEIMKLMNLRWHFQLFSVPGYYLNQN